MSRIPTPTSIDTSPTASQGLLQAVEKQLGSVPNLFRLVATSPAALEGYLSMSGALAKGLLPAATRERIALAVAQVNGCNYCLAAHTYLGKNLAKLGEEEIAANRAGKSLDEKADAAVRFAAQLDAPEPAAVDVRDAIVPREPFIEECVVSSPQVQRTSVLTKLAFNEQLGFAPKGLA